MLVKSESSDRLWSGMCWGIARHDTDTLDAMNDVRDLIPSN